MFVKVITPPTDEPLTVEEVKSFLHGIDYDDQDDNISAFIKAARLKIEHRCGICIGTYELQFVADSFSDKMELPRPPVTNVISVKYLDEESSEQTIDNSKYVLIDDEYSPYIIPLEPWPVTANRPDAVRIQYVAGNEPENVPEELKQAMRWLVGHFFENRESVLLQPTRQEIMELPDSVSAIISPYIVPRL